MLYSGNLASPRRFARHVRALFVSDTDVVSAIGAFVVGFLGNVYSRKMGGTAFTSMVTGVLFLVPVSSFSSHPVLIIGLTPFACY